MSCELPPGYRFYPTEEELVGFYLKNKLDNARKDMERVIPVIDVYGFEPRLLPQMAGEPCIGDPEQWFFFCPRQVREAHGGRPTRTTASGYWKATGSPSYVFSTTTTSGGSRGREGAIGVKKTMVFYEGRAPHGKKTKWKMNEYKALEEPYAPTPNSAPPRVRNDFSLCRVYVKSGCVRSFDRRPSAWTGSDMQRRSMTLPETAPAASRDGGPSASQKAVADAGSHDSSSSGDHGPNGGDVDWGILEDMNWDF